jgi:hypothetical protein
MPNESPQLEEKIDRLTRALERHNNWLWLLFRSFIGAIASTLGVVFVLSAGVYILRKLELLPGLDLFVEQFLPALERYKNLRGF